MSKLSFFLYSWNNGATIMIGVFSFVIIGIIGAVFYMMKNDKKRKND